MADALLRAEGLHRSYPARGRRGTMISVLAGVDLTVEPGQCVGVVGSSGAGKSTLARLLLALERPDAGTVIFDSHPISAMSPAQVRPLRRRFQAVFQDPIASLNPRLTVATIVSEPLVAFGLGSRDERRQRIRELLDQVGLDEGSARRFPGAFSGGERQRIAIARAVAPEPELLILDEPVSFLDLPVQTEILRILAELQTRYGLAMVLISHDMDVVRSLCDRIAVLHDGKIVEEGTTDDVLNRPEHPHTQSLLEAKPSLR
jgi:ABC-type glutathione transport system ATPase component